MRYPSPQHDPRRDACPLCEAPTARIEAYDEPVTHVPTTSTDDDRRLVAILDNIRSAQNVGMMLRSADGVALDAVYLGGLTAAGDHPKVVKTALGAEQSTPWTTRLDAVACVQDLQAAGFEVWAIERTADSVSLQAVTERPPRLAVVVGNERAGIDPAVLRLADRQVHLDMYGTKSTVNVGVAFGTALYWLRTLPVAR